MVVEDLGNWRLSIALSFALSPTCLVQVVKIFYHPILNPPNLIGENEQSHLFYCFLWVQPHLGALSIDDERLCTSNH